MQGLSPSGDSATTGNSPDSNDLPAIRKRNRLPVSCGPCRTKKLRCNRAQPCDKCTKRKEPDACTYASPVTKRRAGSGIQASPDEVRSRIDRLENLVLSLVSQNQPQEEVKHAKPKPHLNASNAKGEDLDMLVKRLGLFKLDGGKATFVPETHWFTILGELSEVKNFFDEHQSQYQAHAQKIDEVSQVDQRPGTLLLCGLPLPESNAELLQAFPHKSLADNLIGRFFEAYNPTLHIIHGPTFQKEYDAFWLDPESVSLPWLAMVFAMMCIALLSFHRSGEEPEEITGQGYQLCKVYRVLTAQCILKHDISVPQAPIVEAMLLHLHAENVMTADMEPGLLQLAALTVRTAMRMGYHIDAAPFPSIKPFQAEMRRRTWALIRHYDLTVSGQNGLPPVVRSDDSNTEYPLNLYDDELSPDMDRLPKDRPLTEVTPSTYMILQAKLMRLFAYVLRISIGVTMCMDYDQVLRQDDKLEEYVRNLPEIFQFSRSHPQTTDSASILLQRIALELIFLRSRTVLHRRWMCRSFFRAQYAFSRNICIEASMRILELQCLITKESMPGGRLSGGACWYSCSLTLTDFFLAGMTIAWDLHITAELERDGIRRMAMWPDEKIESMIDSLEKSLKVWDKFQKHSLDAYKAFSVLSVVLKKIKSQRKGCGLKGGQNYPLDSRKTGQSSSNPDQTTAPVSDPGPSFTSNLNFNSDVDLSKDTSGLDNQQDPLSIPTLPFVSNLNGAGSDIDLNGLPTEDFPFGLLSQEAIMNLFQSPSNLESLMGSGIGAETSLPAQHLSNTQPEPSAFRPLSYSDVNGKTPGISFQSTNGSHSHPLSSTFAREGGNTLPGMNELETMELASTSEKLGLEGGLSSLGVLNGVGGFGINGMNSMSETQSQKDLAGALADMSSFSALPVDLPILPNDNARQEQPSSLASAMTLASQNYPSIFGTTGLMPPTTTNRNSNNLADMLMFPSTENIGINQVSGFDSNDGSTLIGYTPSVAESNRFSKHLPSSSSARGSSVTTNASIPTPPFTIATSPDEGARETGGSLGNPSENFEPGTSERGKRSNAGATGGSATGTETDSRAGAGANPPSNVRMNPSIWPGIGLG